MLRLPRTLDFVLPLTVRAVNLYLIGCGGTGGYLAPALVRLAYMLDQAIKRDATLPSQSPLAGCLRAWSLTFIDGDKVTPANLLRQHFTPAEVGMYKAEALALRYSAAFGIPIRVVNEYVTADTLCDIIGKRVSGDHLPIIFTCVDNHNSRAQVYDFLHCRFVPAVWIDAGNELTSGHVVCGYECPDSCFTLNSLEDGRVSFLPYVVRLFPEILERRDKHPLEMSCAELSVSQPQVMATNLTAATLAANFAYTLLLYPPLRSHAVFFNILSNTFETRLNTVDNLFSAWRPCAQPAQPDQLGQSLPAACLAQRDGQPERLEQLGEAVA